MLSELFKNLIEKSIKQRQDRSIHDRSLSWLGTDTSIKKIALFHFFFRCKNNHTLRNILYKDINGICPKFNEYDRAKKLQLILLSSQIMRFKVPFVKKSIALRNVGSTAA